MADSMRQPPLHAVNDPALPELGGPRIIFPAVAGVEIPLVTTRPTFVDAMFHDRAEQRHISRLVIRAANDVLVRNFGHRPGDAERKALDYCTDRCRGHGSCAKNQIVSGTA